MNKIIPTFVLLTLLILSMVSRISAETVWADQVDESDSITFTVIPGEFEKIQDQQDYNAGLGHDGRDGDKYIVDPISGMTSDFDLREGDRLELEITKNDDNIRINSSSDYHLIFLPIKKDSTSYFDLLFNDTELIEDLTGGRYLNSTVDNIVELFVEYDSDYIVKYEWDNVTGTMISKVVWDEEGNKLQILPNPNAGLVPISNSSIVLSIIIIVGIRMARTKGHDSKNVK